MEKEQSNSLELFARLQTSAYHTADRAWEAFRTFITAQALLAAAWAALMVGNVPHKIYVLAAVSGIGVVTGFLWSMLVTRMWHYHLEYADWLRRVYLELPNQGLGYGVTAWQRIDGVIDAHWRDNPELAWMRGLSGNQLLLFLSPLLLSFVHMMMFHVTFAAVGYVPVLGWLVFLILTAFVWNICEPVLMRPTFGVNAMEPNNSSGKAEPARRVGFRWLDFALVVLTALGVMSAFTAVYYQHEDQKELVRVQVALEMVKLFDSAELRRARQNYAKELLAKKEPDGNIREQRVLDFFETLGDMLDQGRTDEETVYSNFSYDIYRYWAASRPHVLAMRKRENDDELYAGFEELSETLATGEAARRGVPVEKIRPSEEKWRQFLSGEAALPI